MRKLFVVGMVAVVYVVVGIAACGKSDKAKAKTSVAETSAVPVQNVEQAHDAADVTPAPGDATVTGESLAGAFEKAPRLTLELSEGKSGFKFRSKMLSDEAKAKIDELFNDDTIDLSSAHFEIEGYTDNLGTKEVNDQYGLARAKAVKQYIAEHYEIPPDCIHAVSFGMEKPVADNSTPEGRAKNRRVVIKVVD